MVNAHPTLCFCLGGAALALTGCGGPPLAESLGLVEPRWALHELAPPPGSVLVTIVTFSATDGEMVVGSPIPVHGTMSMELRSRVRETLSSATHRERTLEESRMRMTFTVLDHTETEEEEDPLVGVPVVGDATAAGGWTWRLTEGLPTDEQREALGDIAEDGGMVPAEPVGVGDTWLISADRLLGGSTGGLGREGSGNSGFATVHFERLSEHLGEPCAELSYAASDLEMPIEESSGVATAHMTLAGTSCLSMRTGVELVGVSRGWIAWGVDPNAEGAKPSDVPFMLAPLEVSVSGEVLPRS